MKLLSKVPNPFLTASLAIVLAFTVYLSTPPDISEAMRRMAFIFAFAALFWGLEIIPLYATSLLVVLLETFLLCRPGGVLNMKPNGYEIFLLPLGSSTIILFFGGFVLARAMQKYEVDKYIAGHLLRIFSRQPYFIMLGFMTATACLAMWVTITASSAMMIAMVLPLLKQLKDDDRFRTGFIIAIPLAATIGALGTPVATPPNAIAIATLAEHGIYLNFISWMKIALPIVIVLIVLTSFMIYAIFPSKHRELRFDLRMERKHDHAFKMALGIAVVTVLLWLTSGWHKIPSAMIAMLSAGLFATMGLLKTDDFRSIEWDILILMWGGLALGEGLEVTGLSKWVVSWPVFQQQGFALVVIFTILAGVLTIFMSNTATANLLLPIAMAVPVGNPIVLILSITFACSLSTVLPVSTPGYAMAYSTNMVKSKDLIGMGILFTVISITVALFGVKFLTAYIKL